MTKKTGVRKRGVYSGASVTENAPTCYHGAKLLFEEKTTKIHTYRCAGFRTARACRKDAEACTSYRLKRMTSALHLCTLPQGDRCYCHTCNLLFARSVGLKDHLGHNFVSGLAKGILRRPSYLLEPLQLSSAHAQIFFSLDWLNFLVAVFHDLGVRNVLCVGAPRLFDFLRIHTEDKYDVTTFLLDIDARLFYAPEVFAQFNMLNGHFFEEDTGCAAISTFFEACNGRSIIFCDPPFSVMLQPLMVALTSLMESMKKNGTGEFLRGYIPFIFFRKL
uniref:Zinc finger CCHC domain-containing protein 4 n=1 Tax=Schistocephalus solidus TaxID=70667 RepID=A0A0X3NV11_SCHSO